MTGTRRTAILETSDVAVPILARQIFAGEIIHGGAGRNKILTCCHWERGSPPVLKRLIIKQIPLMMRNNSQGGGMEGIQDIDVEYKDEDDCEGKDNYDYQGNSTIDDLWYEL